MEPPDVEEFKRQEGKGLGFSGDEEEVELKGWLAVGEGGPVAGFEGGSDGPEGKGDEGAKRELGGEGTKREHGHDEIAVPGVLAEDLDAEELGDEA